VKPVVIKVYPSASVDATFETKASLIQERLTFVSEAPEMMSFFYEEPKVTKELLINEKQKVTEDILPEVLSLLTETLENVPDWTEESIKDALLKSSDEKGLKRGQVLWPLRAALTGLPYSPGAFEVAAALGKTKTLERLHKLTK